jgi:hypothetical protein
MTNQVQTPKAEEDDLAAYSFCLSFDLGLNFEFWISDFASGHAFDCARAGRQ